MHKLTQFRLCPQSRSIRLILAELEIAVELADEKPWAMRPEFLALNPACELPVLELEGGPILCGTYSISEFMAEEITSHPKDGRTVPMFPGSREERAEIRRITDWFHGKFHREVSRDLLYERAYAHQVPGSTHTPDREILKAVRANLRYHMSYIDYLSHNRRWLAGEELSFADFAAAAQISVSDYLGEIAWEEHPSSKLWYSRMKSRPSFRALLADRMPGVPPSVHYAILDF